MKFKKYNEKRDLIIAWLGISLIFAIVLGGFNIFEIFRKQASIFNVFKYIGLSLIVTATAFILHELAHKYSAIYLGAKAKFILWKNSLIFSVFFAIITGFVFVAPGAVYVYGKTLSLKEDGLTSLAGPVTNIIMGLLFILVGSVFVGFNSLVIQYGVFINFWIALFNLIPIGPLDGKKIFLWNPAVWVITTIIPFIFIFVI